MQANRVVGELVKCPWGGEFVRVEIHADAKCGYRGVGWTGKGKSSGVPAGGGFLSPCFVRVVEVGFPVMGKD